MLDAQTRVYIDTMISRQGTKQALLAAAAAAADVIAASAALSTFTPTRIPTGQVFTVPADTQALWAVPITVDGSIAIDGVLVQVD